MPDRLPDLTPAPRPVLRCLGLGLLVAALAGCGADLAWKRGAREQDWEADRAACAGAEVLEACMATRGWHQLRLDDGEPAAVAGATVIPAGEPHGQVGQAGQAGQVAGLRTAQPAAATLARIEGGRASRPRASGPPAEARTLAPPEPGPRPEAPERGGSGQASERMAVRAWWKPGGRGEEVEAETARCVTRLGAAHAPEAGHYTPALLACLRAAGWQALRVEEAGR